jgi:hypothetical protein
MVPSSDLTVHTDLRLMLFVPSYSFATIISKMMGTNNLCLTWSQLTATYL